MDKYLSPRVTGACLIGFAIVGGTYLATNFGQTKSYQPSGLVAQANNTPLRFPIEVRDSSGDGIEDWRDQFISAPPIQRASSSLSSTYTPPETITEQLGISLMEGLFASMGDLPLKSRDRVISDTVSGVQKATVRDKIYDIRDITISQDTSDLAVKNYGNRLALIILGDNKHGLRNEIVILESYFHSPNEQDLKDLVTISELYKNYRDEAIKLPVPTIFAKQHLDLINVFNALYINIDALAKADKDPILPLIRLKRYEEDVLGLALAMKNMYEALATRANAFDVNDPAVLFISFNFDIR